MNTRRQKFFFKLILCLVISIFFYLNYQLNDKNNQLKIKNDAYNFNLKNVNKKLNNQTAPSLLPINNVQIKLKNLPLPKPFTCIEENFSNTSTDVQMLNLYEIIPFDNLDGGVWKQGWEIQNDYNKHKNKEKLQVFIVFHSHTDPAWLKTFEEYFIQDTKEILDNMYDQLSANPDLKFIYAEMSFFELWWSRITPEKRKNVKQLINNGQLEIVTGGWVMTDEATSNYFSTIIQLIEGHEFLYNQMEIHPKNHWAIDPFGLSPTISYLLKKAHISNMVIHRVHYSVKKYLAKNKYLEFKWRQLFAGLSNKTDITTHIFPFFSYDVPHTCGPDPKICCQFDFYRLRKSNCPWLIPPEEINNLNIAEKALLLVDQYRKKASLFKTNALLIPLGDDFRYKSRLEWIDQYKNYKLLIEYINKKSEWNMEIKFGTLSDYFNAAEKNFFDVKDKLSSNLPILTGDFFTYADIDKDYWSGYYTTRPFYKYIDRTLQHYLRAAEMLFSFAYAKFKKSFIKHFDVLLYNQLIESRRALSLFQHHDGVSGTSRSYVMQNYMQKMLHAINNCKKIISSASKSLLNVSSHKLFNLKIDENYFTKDLPEKVVLNDNNIIILFNSLSHTLNKSVCIYVNSTKIRIVKNDDQILQQIEPIFFVNKKTKNIEHFTNKFKLCFLANLPAFSFSQYNLIKAKITQKVKLQSSFQFLSQWFDTEKINLNGDEELFIENKYLKAVFDKNSFYLKEIIQNFERYPIQMSYIKFGSQSSTKSGHSGAYLFLPNNEGTKILSKKNSFVIAKGPDEFNIEQIISLDLNSYSLNIKNYINLNFVNNYEKESVEIAMHLKTNIGSKEEEEMFFTDLNNFQMIRRRRFKKLPLQAHFYPMSGAAYIENSKIRLTLLGRQALGVANFKPGEITIMLDRRLYNDDNRGLMENVVDNYKTISSFKLFVEKNSNYNKKKTNNLIGFHSLHVNMAQLLLHYPPIVLYKEFNINDTKTDYTLNYVLIKNKTFSCDVHVVLIRSLSLPTIYSSVKQLNYIKLTQPDNSLGIILHRFGINCDYYQTDITHNIEPYSSCRDLLGQINLNSLTEAFNLKSILNVSLTFLNQTNKLPINSLLELDQMDIQNLKLLL